MRERYLPARQTPLTPNGTSTLTVPKEKVWDKEMVRGIKKKDFVIYVFGIARYDDHAGAHHTTRYCHYFDPNECQLKVHTQYNYMD